MEQAILPPEQTLKAGDDRRSCTAPLQFLGKPLRKFRRDRGLQHAWQLIPDLAIFSKALQVVANNFERTDKSEKSSCQYRGDRFQ